MLMISCGGVAVAECLALLQEDFGWLLVQSLGLQSIDIKCGVCSSTCTMGFPYRFSRSLPPSKDMNVVELVNLNCPF